ncbi:hypothetical protein BC940DRAFT_300325 [Gongronella butleri]|nr:hypothetical protein BC940DRAFT_300325 [Gongronella butleri]
MPGLHVARKLPSPEGTIGELQAILADIVKSVESSTFEPTNNEFTGKITAVIAEINELHDVLMNRLQDTKVDTANSKNTMDDKQRELQDAIYEKRHILEEIQKCRQLRTVFQHLELLPLDTFFATAPAHYAGRDQTEHAQMINRLLFEKEERARQVTRKKSTFMRKATRSHPIFL